jgi:D-alanyl-D-alanine carboxypeptidase
LQEGVTLQVVSAYRGYLYQANLILNKLNKGVALEDILKVLALPGFSEHHTGRALDLSSTETKDVLVEDFEKTKAFAWLIENAHKFQFYLSYPRDNKAGFIYEPWHWCYKLSEAML